MIERDLRELVERADAVLTLLQRSARAVAAAIAAAPKRHDAPAWRAVQRELAKAHGEAAAAALLCEVASDAARELAREHEP